MSFYLFLACGFAGGLLGGMGMGGGTVLIPLLTLLCGVDQRTAQGVNLLSFLPMAALALRIHAKNGLLERERLPSLLIPALVAAAGGAFLAAFLPAGALRRAFGAFLCVLSLFQFNVALKKGHNE